MDFSEFVDDSDTDMHENSRMNMAEEQRVVRGTNALLQIHLKKQTHILEWK